MLIVHVFKFVGSISLMKCLYRQILALFPSPTIFIMFCLLMGMLGRCAGQDVYKCHNHAGNFEGGYCANTQFSRKECELATSTEEDLKIRTTQIAATGADYTEALCQAEAKAYDTDILKPGCVAMDGTLKKETLCVKSLYCKHAQEKTSWLGECLTDDECTATTAAGSPAKFCCDSIKKHLKDRCSKHDKYKLGEYMQTIRRDAKCASVECVSSGSFVRAAHILVFLLVSISLFLAGTY